MRVIDRWPSHAWIARVSWPLLARVYPQAWRSMCGWVEFEASAGGSALDHPGRAGGRERGSPLADEDKRRRLALALEPAQSPELVASPGGLGVPFLTRRTCSTAALNSTWSHRRSQSSAARSPCRKASRIMVASR
jgi:hypothetical protein